MATQTIEQFFTGQTLVIPAYQRDYPWTTGNIDDLFEDIEEAMELDSGHYLGTFTTLSVDAAELVECPEGIEIIQSLAVEIVESNDVSI